MSVTPVAAYAYATVSGPSVSGADAIISFELLNGEFVVVKTLSSSFIVEDLLLAEFLIREGLLGGVLLTERFVGEAKPPVILSGKV